jgi:hypothetical protein
MTQIKVQHVQKPNLGTEKSRANRSEDYGLGNAINFLLDDSRPASRVPFEVGIAIANDFDGDLLDQMVISDHFFRIQRLIKRADKSSNIFGCMDHNLSTDGFVDEVDILFTEYSADDLPFILMQLFKLNGEVLTDAGFVKAPKQCSHDLKLMMNRRDNLIKALIQLAAK